MNKKKILLVSASFYPVNSPRSFRTSELANEFARQGHEVTVYIPFNGYDYSDYAKESNIRLKDLGNINFRKIAITGKGVGRLIRRITRRTLGLLFEYPGIELMYKVSKRLKSEENYDMLISIAVPFTVHWGVAKARNKHHRIADVWVADCGDPYMGSTTDSFGKPFYFRYIEKWFSRKADFITIPFEGARKGYYPEFHDKIRVIPQGFRLDNISLPEYSKNTEYPVFAYAGGFIPGRRDPTVMLNFLSESGRQFRFIVYTSQADLLLPFKNILKEKLEIRNYVPREELLKILSGMDFLINFDNNTHTQLPSKLIDYAITGRPVLNITSQTDFSVLLEFMDGNYNRKMKLGDPENYNIRMVTGKFVQLLNN